VENLKISGNWVAVVWFGAGMSSWTNVEMIGTSYGWYDAVGNSGDVCGNSGRHDLFSSTVIGGGGAGIPAFRNACGKVWMHGGEVRTLNPASSAIDSIGGVNEFHLYGGNISTVGGAAVTSRNGAHVHVHGTGIDVISAAPSPIVVLRAEGGGEIHADASAYNLSTGAGGTVTRISVDANSHIHAPNHWQHIPSFTLLNSVSGADTTNVFVQETVTPPGGQPIQISVPHHLIYSNACGSKWYDPADKVCRNATGAVSP
jgi:hypothetical protein